jgi:hypothetical protein
MALKNGSSFTYGLQVSSANSSLDFVASSGGPAVLATLNSGYYSLQDLGAEVIRAMGAADPVNTYSYSITRTSSGNSITIATTGSYLSLLFGTGPRVTTSIGPTLGFTATDKTGSLSYTSTSSAGTLLFPSLVGYTYLPPSFMQKMIGTPNISASGIKETIYFATHQFFQVEFKYEPEIKVTNEWASLLQWASKGRPLEFCPDVTAPNTVFNCTLEKTSYDGKGMGYQFKEMLPDFPFLYTTGQMVYRIIPPAVSYA